MNMKQRVPGGVSVRCGVDARTDKNSRMPAVMRRKMAEHAACSELSHLTHEKAGCPTARPSISNVPCENGMSGEYECDNVDLYAFISVADMDSPGTNDIWGWTDPETVSYTHLTLPTKA